MATILYVDDNPLVLTLRAATLRIAGFEVVTCESPFEGLALLSSGTFDGLVTDFEMPGLDGYALADRARANGWAGPIIMCTGTLSLPPDLKHSVDSIVRKAQPPMRLAEAIHHCLRLHALKEVAQWTLLDPASKSSQKFAGIGSLVGRPRSAAALA